MQAADVGGVADVRLLAGCSTVCSLQLHSWPVVVSIPVPDLVTCAGHQAFRMGELPGWGPRLSGAEEVAVDDWKDSHGNPVVARSVDARAGVFLSRSGVVSTQMAVGVVEIEDEHDKHRIFFVSFSFEDTNLNLIFMYLAVQCLISWFL